MEQSSRLTRLSGNIPRLWPFVKFMVELSWSMSIYSCDFNRKNKQNIPEWKSIFGAKVESPIDVPGEIFKVMLVRCILHQAFGIILKFTLLFYGMLSPLSLTLCWNACLTTMKRPIVPFVRKKHIDKMGSSNWHGMCVNNLGRLAIHQTRWFI